MALSTSFSDAASRTAHITTATRHASRKPNIGLWTIQGVLAAVFLLAGVSKLVMPAGDLADSDLAVAFLRFIGVCETLGAVGLVLPWLLNIRRGLTPLAAAGLVVIMAGATVLTAATRPVAFATFPLAVGVAAAWVACGRRNA
jgi:hypothetical protein